MKPLKNNTWETWFPMGENDTYMGVLKYTLIPAIKAMHGHGRCDWYCFLVHRMKDFIPNYNEDTLAYHLRFSAKEKITKSVVESLEAVGGVYTQKMIFHPNDYIVGINTDFLKKKNIMLAWEFLGKQSQLIVDLVELHGDMEIPDQHFGQFFHYFSNMTGFRFVTMREIKVHHIF